MRVKYVGPSPHVMAGRDGVIYGFPHGEPVDVPDDLGASLCEQDTFECVDKKSKADPAATDTAQEG